MKKIIAVISFFIGFFLLTNSVFAQSTAFHSEEKIEFFESQINVQTNGIVDVVETIKYNFDSLQRHGIYRIIPTTKITEKKQKSNSASKFLK